MPLYDYECESCKEVFEDLRKVDEQEIECPKCKGKAKRRVSKSNFKIIDPTYGFNFGE